jgi:hypothetical protein
MSFLEIALRNVARGFKVLPLHGKACYLKEWPSRGTDDREIIEGWAKEWPEANCGVNITDELMVLESDNRAGLEKLLGAPVPRTYTVQASENRPHWYFYQTEKSRAFGNQDLEGIFEFKQWHRLAVAEGSIHPKSGLTYLVIDDSPIIPIPDWIIERLPRKEKAGPMDPAEKVGIGGRHEFLTKIAGGLRNAGLDEDGLLQSLEIANNTRLAEPLPMEDLKHIAHSMMRYAVPPPEPKVLIGSPVEVTGVDDADEVIEKQPRPVYPDDVWTGTAYGEFADLCTADNNIPKKFFAEGIRTMVGAIVGDQLKSKVSGASARAYTILIAPPGKGKGTTVEQLMRLFHEPWRSAERDEPPLLFRKDSIWRSKKIGVQILSPSSAPGLMKALEPEKTKKGENPINVWQPRPRCIVLNEEIRTTFANFGLDTTGAGLESVLCELFDRPFFSATVTATRGVQTGEVSFSLLGGITKDGWDAVFSQASSVESGFLSRVNIIASEGKFAAVAGLTDPDFTDLQRRFFPRILELQHGRRELPPTPAASALINEWFSRLEENHTRTRLNIHAWRSALHIAWLKGADFITEAHVADAIRLAEYQRHMRIWYAPTESDSKAGRCQASIRRVLQATKQIRLRDLKKQTNYHRMDGSMWNKCLDFLVKTKEIRLDEGERGAVTVILLKQKD